MTATRYIVIPNWDRFQHYKNRNPSWIKNYVELLDDPEYRRLGYFHRGLLHGLWLMYATSRGQVPASPAYIADRLALLTEAEARTRRLGGDSVATGGRLVGDSRATRDADDGDRPVRARDLTRLEKAGFLTIVASRPLAIDPTRASPEESREEYKDLKAGAHAQKGKTKGAAFAKNVVLDPVKRMIANGAITDLVDLTAELTARGINGAQADELRALLPPRPA